MTGIVFMDDDDLEQPAEKKPGDALEELERAEKALQEAQKSLKLAKNQIKKGAIK